MRPAEFQQHFIARAKEGDMSARHELVKTHLELVVSRAKRHSRPGAFLEMGDLIQQGCVGLLRAIEKYDCDRRSNGKKVSFVTYATYWIEHAIRRTIQNHGRTIAIPISVQRDIHAVRCASMKVQISGDPVGDTSAIAQALGMSEERCEALSNASHEVLSLDAFSEENISPYRNIIHMRLQAEESERLFQEGENCHRVRELVERLSESERAIIEALFGLKDGLEPKSTEEVGRLMGVSSRRVRKVREKALQKLKLEMEL